MDKQTYRFLVIINRATNPLLDNLHFKNAGIPFDNILGEYTVETGEKTYDLEKRRSYLKTLISLGLVEQSASFPDCYKITNKGIDYINQSI